jgi:hypothetical protein
MGIAVAILNQWLIGTGEGNGADVYGRDGFHRCYG